MQGAGLNSSLLRLCHRSEWGRWLRSLTSSWKWKEQGPRLSHRTITRSVTAHFVIYIYIYIFSFHGESRCWGTIILPKPLLFAFRKSALEWGWGWGFVLFVAMTPESRLLCGISRCSLRPYGKKGELDSFLCGTQNFLLTPLPQKHDAGAGGQILEASSEAYIQILGTL